MGEVESKPEMEGPGAFRRFRTELDKQFRAALMSYFGKRVASRTEAEDLTQEVFVRLLSRTEAPHAASVRPYVFTVAANLLRDRARRAISHQAHAHVPLGDDTGYMVLDHREPERVLIGKEALEEALAALSELNELTRDIFILFRLEKMRQRDIAALFGLSVSTIEKHIMKAMSHLGSRFAVRSNQQ